MKKQYSEVVATDFRVGETKSGHPQLEITLQIVDCDKKERIGEVIRHYQVVMMDSDKSCEYAIKALRNLGMQNTDIFKPEGLGSVRASCCECYTSWDSPTGLVQKWESKYINEIKSRESITGSVADEFSAKMAALFANEQPLEVSDTNRAPTELPQATDFPTPDAPVDDTF